MLRCVTLQCMEQARAKLIPFLLLLLIIPVTAKSLHAQQTTIVVRVVDGDTLKVRYWGKEESIRLICIDTPESKVNTKAKRDAEKLDRI